jgi:hypothetical protein
MIPAADCQRRNTITERHTRCAAGFLDDEDDDRWPGSESVTDSMVPIITDDRGLDR